jgi:L-ascorbate metabolism protein UlaG (beta-lactamase superfamily)
LADHLADDHLDYYSIVDVWKYHQETVHFFVPFGLAQWFIATGISEDRVTEMDWWSESILSFPAPSSSSSPLDASDDQSQRNGVDETASLNLKVVCTPAQHRSGRGVMDHMKTLWASWCIGVIEKEDADKAEERGMLGWKGFKLYFGG